MVTISLSKFLARFYLLEGERLKEFTHKDVKNLFPYVESVYADEKIDETRERILVKDSKGAIKVYYIPELTFDEVNDTLYVFGKESNFDNINDNVYDYCRLKEYQLRNLLVRSKNSLRNQNEARNELKRRGIALTKKYNRNEFKKYRGEE